MRVLVKAVLPIALFSSAARAANWQLASTSTEGTRTYLDVSSIVRDGNYRTTWEKLVLTKPERDGTTYSVGHWRYDCTGRTYVMLSSIYYRADGTVISSSQIPTYRQEKRDVAPDTIAETLLNLVCG